MREFLREQLLTLKAKRGLRQVEHNTNEEITDLLNEIEKTCVSSIVPTDRQKSIIKSQIIIDPDFIGLNAHVVSKWFFREVESNRAHYMTLMQNLQEPMLEKEREKEAEKYRKQLEAKKKKNPNYDPIAAGQKRLKKLISKDKDVRIIRTFNQNLTKK